MKGNRMPGTALVTGASAGIGEEFARQLAANGWDLVLVARGVEPLETLAATLRKQYGVSVEVLPADLGDPEQRALVAERIADRAHPIDRLINNAGFGTIGPFHEQTAESQVGMVDVNVTAVVALTHAAIPAMLERGRGSILNVSSIGGFQASPAFAVYAATKSFLTAFTTAIHEELLDTNIAVTALCPGFTRTQFQQRSGMEMSSMPNFVWHEPKQVVDAALAGLEKNRAVVIPGALNKATVGVVKLLPAVLARKLAKLVGES